MPAVGTAKDGVESEYGENADSGNSGSRIAT
jgi:hypothetical protein